MLDFDLRPERDSLRRVAEAEARIHETIEQKRRAVAEKRAQLEAQLAEAEEALVREEEAARVLHAEVALDQLQEDGKAHGGLLGTWPEVERAAAAARAAGARLATMRQRVHERAEAERQELETKSGLYQVYCAATGVRWDTCSDGVEGYVAIGARARAFKVEDEDKVSRKATADSLWSEIEACLPPDALELLEPDICGADESDEADGSPFDDCAFAVADEA
mmetsp:Transcript_85551/g.215623  ORF Transcript_85551/g.215623 Transcript_85551/m.215623 type:complete len:221 (-) Transcript_85551:97-759(-)